MDKAIIISRVAEILKETPSAQEVVKQGKNRQKRFDYLATHMVNKAIAEDALILAGEATGIAILFKMNASKKTLQDRIDELKLVWNVTGFKNALKILDKQKYIKSQRPKTGDYLYCWFWGITKNSRGADTQIGKEMKDEFLRRADKDNIPLYAETAIRKNAIVYQKFGFELFHTWKREDGSNMWFLRYLPNRKK